MKQNIWILFSGLIILSCNKGSNTSSTPTTPKVIPTITTQAATNSVITRTTASAGGNVTSDGGATITAVGFCYNTSPNPTVSNTTIASAAVTGSFTVNITGLVANTTYYGKAYATNSVGTVYGNEISFTTRPLSIPNISSVKTIFSFAAFSATVITYINDDGGKSITTRGVCFSSAHLPTITDTKTSDGMGTDPLTSLLNGLSPNTTYVLRAYASNSIGTAYGDSITIVSDVEGNIYNIVKIGSQLWTIENLKTTKYNDGVDIPYVTDSRIWSNILVAPTPMFCWYNNNINYKDTTGALYNFLVVNTGKLAPTGWHVPSHKEMGILFSTLDSKYDIRNGVYNGIIYESYSSPISLMKLTEAGYSHWKEYAGSPDFATNESGFTAIGSGLRQEKNGQFAYYKDIFAIWTSTKITPTLSQNDRAYYLTIGPKEDQLLNISDIGYTISSLQQGNSVRCLKN